MTPLCCWFQAPKIPRDAPDPSSNTAPGLGEEGDAGKWSGTAGGLRACGWMGPCGQWGQGGSWDHPWEAIAPTLEYWGGGISECLKPRAVP